MHMRKNVWSSTLEFHADSSFQPINAILSWKMKCLNGSTLTVTNLGMFGISDFYGIINPNNAAILVVP
jgi:hypothetical protein